MYRLRVGMSWNDLKKCMIEGYFETLFEPVPELPKVEMKWRDRLHRFIIENNIGKIVSFPDCDELKLNEFKAKMLDGYENKVAELEKQIEDMKNCYNCKYQYPAAGEDFDDYCENCEQCSEWCKDDNN